MITSTLGTIYLLLIAFTIIFQLGLIFGRPWGELTMGGYNKGVLPVKLRIAPVVSILILVFFGLFVIDTTQIVSSNLNFPDGIKWFAIGFNVLALIANSITKSEKERKLWQPITAVMLICSVLLFL